MAGGTFFLSSKQGIGARVAAEARLEAGVKVRGWLALDLGMAVSAAAAVTAGVPAVGNKKEIKCLATSVEQVEGARLGLFFGCGMFRMSNIRVSRVPLSLIATSALYYTM